MAYPAYIREKAEDLREHGLTIDEIAECLAISRTTVFYWVRRTPIPPTSAQTAVRKRASRANARRYQQLREAAYDEGTRVFPHLERQDGFRDFICLYIAEGYKRNRNKVSICNSDPAVMRLACSWMRRLSANPLRYSVQYHADQDLGRIRDFWAGELGIEPDEVKLQRKSNSNQLSGRKWRSEHGVLNIEAADTYFRAELQSWIDWLEDEWLDSLP
jgi:hypothetical protein